MSGYHFGRIHVGELAPVAPAGAAAPPRGLRRVILGTPPWVKLSAGVGLVVVTMALPAAHARWLGLVAAFAALVAPFTAVPLRDLARRLLVPAPFVLGLILASILGSRAAGTAVDWRLTAARSLLCIVLVVLVSATTPFGEIIRVLRRLRVPSLLLTTMALMHRYLFVLAEETLRMRRARASRTFVRSRPLEWRVMATVASRLFERTVVRAERIHDAMCARGWR